MCDKILSKNLTALRNGNPDLALLLERTPSDSTYQGSILAKNGLIVPCYGDGTPANSRYDPCAEAERVIAELDKNTFVLFLGIAGAYHIRAFLRKFPEAHCAAAEATLPALRSLLETVPLDDVLSQNTIHILKDCQPQTLETVLPEWYLPALYGSFATCSFRSWSARFASTALHTAVTKTLDVISRDYSVQAHFGRIWFSNIIRNFLAMKGQFCTSLPIKKTKTTALIAAAGPSLEKALSKIVEKRTQYTIFSTDTAYGTLLAYGIVPEYYVTIDPQYYSSQHLFPPITSDTIVVADCIAQPIAIKKAISSGARVILAAGGHPLAHLAANFSSLPVLNTSSGTVTGAARNAAIALGYASPHVIGDDFAYTGGKPYARGTYLSELFDSVSARTSSTESAFVTLMFRTEVARIRERSGLTYCPPNLRSYCEAMRVETQTTTWSNNSFSSFPVDAFLVQLTEGLESLYSCDNIADGYYRGMLPLFAWFQKTYALPASEKSRKKAIQLALDLIAGYTAIS